MQPARWSFIDLQSGDPLGLLALVNRVPSEWLARPPKSIHCTVLLNLNDAADVDALHRVTAVTPPFELHTRCLQLAPVERMLPEEVYAIVLLLRSPALRVLREAFMEQRGIAHQPDRIRVHDPYGGEGHVSLAYIKAAHKDAAQRFVAEESARLQDASFLVREIVIERRGEPTQKLTLACP